MGAEANMSFRIVTVATLLLVLPFTSVAANPVGIGTTDLYFVQANAYAGLSCSGDECWYKMNGGATGCALTGGSVVWRSTIGFGGEFEVPVADCASDSDGATGGFGSNCHTVTATLVAAVPLADEDFDCATPIECNIHQRAYRECLDL